MSHPGYARSGARRFRDLLGGHALIRAVGAHNGLTARLAERAGFEAVWASGFEISASYAVPDASLLTMTQLLDSAEAMQAATSLPVVADCDTGFGGPLNVAHAVRSYERRGIAGICIEDKIFPKVNSFATMAQDLISVEDFSEKVKAGKAAQITEAFVLIARTEALIAGLDVDEALRRSCSYAAAGADAILVHSRSRDPSEVLEFATRWNEGTPLIAVPTTYPDVYEKELFEAGFSMVIYANYGIRAAINGISSVLAALAHAGRGREVQDQIASIGDVFDLQGTLMSFNGDA